MTYLKRTKIAWAVACVLALAEPIGVAHAKKAGGYWMTIRLRWGKLKESLS